MMLSPNVYLVYGKVPTRQVHSTVNAFSESGHTRKQINLLEAVIPMHVRLKSGS